MATEYRLTPAGKAPAVEIAEQALPGSAERPTGTPQLRTPDRAKLIKVDRVRSVAEATDLEALGTDLIGVSLTADPRFHDDRTVTVEQAAAIGGALRRATLVTAMELGQNPDRLLCTVAATRAGLVQPITGAIPPPEVRSALSDAGVGIVYGGIEIAHDDDPGWVFGAYTGEPDLNAALFHADVLPEYRNSWAFLRDRAPEYDEEFQIADLDALGRERPIAVGLDFTADNVREIVAALPSVWGIALTLAEQGRRSDARFHRYADAVSVLRAANASRPAPGTPPTG